jgi:DNA (cytosine-5)-methyltransferase 1
MKYLSLCSGIEAATVAWHPLGWEAVAYSEIEKFPSQVLAHHYPQTPNLGDMTKFKEWSIESNVDLLVGGTPCQSFSVAGLRKGLDDPRGNLMLTYLAIADKYRPRWLVWENVPGVLSSNGGQDFGVFLGALGELGYGFAYRVLDAQYFGVAQRRRRVFVVGYLGDWRPAAAVLFERHSLSGNPAPSREKREVTPTLTKEGIGVSRTGHNEDGWYLTAPKPSRMVAFGEYSEDGTASAMKARDYKDATDLVAQPAYGIPGNWIGRKPENGGNATEPMHDIAPCLTKADQHGVAQPICLMDQGGSVMNIEHDMTGTLRRETHGHEPVVMQHMAVRRLTPKECERLQGFPDNYTDIQAKGKPTPDGPRYKALGNSMAVPVMAWIGQRIQEVEAICKQNK